jgi:hypothetical protein
MLLVMGVYLLELIIDFIGTLTLNKGLGTKQKKMLNIGILLWIFTRHIKTETEMPEFL